MTRKILFSLVVLFTPFSLSAIIRAEKPCDHHTIGYSLSGGRFGDNMLAYCQARYISFITGIPFVYSPFPYSDMLTTDFQTLQATSNKKVSKYRYNVFPINSTETLAKFLLKIQDKDTPPTHFIVNYVPSDISEWDRDAKNSILYIIPWHDEGFARYLKQCTTPRIAIPNLRKDGRLNIADHVRTLSGNDTTESILAFPLKHPKVIYHKRQIKRVYELNLRRPMHVFLFSDTKNPQALLEDFRNSFIGEDIIFDIQDNSQGDTNAVIQDFFAMQAFDVLIATRSNFSMMAYHLGSFDMVLFPVHAKGKYPDTQIDRVQVISKKSNWFPYELNLILEEEN